MNKKIIAYLASGLLLFGAVTGLGALQARAAVTADPVVHVDNAQQQQRNEQDQSYTSSIRTNNPQDAGEAKGQDNEAAESSSLQSLAKINADEAKAAALKAVPGTVKQVSLDNENGNVVYSVAVQTVKGVTDVKVDAGNGQVLAQDNEQDKEGGEQDKEGGQENDAAEGGHGPDNDNVQSEQ